MPGSLTNLKIVVQPLISTHLARDFTSIWYLIWIHSQRMTTICPFVMNDNSETRKECIRTRNRADEVTVVKPGSH